MSRKVFKIKIMPFRCIKENPVHWNKGLYHIHYVYTFCVQKYHSQHAQDLLCILAINFNPLRAFANHPPSPTLKTTFSTKLSNKSICIFYVQYGLRKGLKIWTECYLFKIKRLDNSFSGYSKPKNKMVVLNTKIYLIL